VVVVLLGVGWAGYAWSQDQYYVGAHNGQVAIYQGLHQHVLGKSMSHSVETSEVPLADLPTLDRDKVQDSIFAASLDEAHEVLSRLRIAAAGCRQERADVAAANEPTETATPTPSPSKEPIAGVGTGRAAGTPTPSATPTATPDSSVTPSPQPTAPLQQGCARVDNG
jgi:protein phosphatase